MRTGGPITIALDRTFVSDFATITEHDGAAVTIPLVYELPVLTFEWSNGESVSFVLN